MLARMLGIAVTIAALGYVGARIVESASLIGTAIASPAFISAVAVGGLAYALNCGLIGGAWFILLNARNRELDLRDGLIIFARSQIYKYLPTNVLHLVGRYGMALKAGASHASLIFVTVAESVLLITAAATVAIVFALPLFLQRIVPALQPYAPAPIVAIALCALIASAIYWLARQGHLTLQLMMASLIAFALYLAFFFINGAILWVGMTIFSSGESARNLVVFGVAAAAWLAGYVVPGAPAGLGVRDVVLTAGLELAGYGQGALLIAVAYRLITLVGDVLVALAGFTARQQTR
jgi:glycosyltransferase 2 family protein